MKNAFFTKYGRIIIHILQIILLFIIIKFYCPRNEGFQNFVSGNKNRNVNKKKYFNLDLHISVIQDFVDLQRDLSYPIDITDYSLSGHAKIMGKKNTDKFLINSGNWERFLGDEDKRHKFYRKHFTELNSYDGFVITHTPSFILLYEKFNKPMIIINSCRYENPFMNDISNWNLLNKTLRNAYSNKLVKIVSNNKADQKYLELGTGIKSTLIPSLCLYTNAKYSFNNSKNSNKNKWVIFDRFNLVEENTNTIKKEKLGTYSWDELYSYRGIIHIPYEVSTMSVFEQYSANVPLFFPSKKYLKQLVADKKVKLQSKYSHTYPETLETALGKGNNFDFWIDNADFYDSNNMPHIQFFNSMEELYEKISIVDTEKISNLMKEQNKKRKQEVVEKWNTLMMN